MDGMIRKPYQRYPEVFRLRVVEFYYEHGCDVKLTQERFGVDHASIRDWLRRFGSRDRVGQLIEREREREAQSLAERAGARLGVALPELPAEVRDAFLEMQRELEMERLRGAAMSEMIDQAEMEYRLPIRKKYGAGQ